MRAYFLLVCLMSIALTGCGSDKQASDDDILGVQSESKAGATVEELNKLDMAAAPKYVQPTMDNLRGKPFRFPSEYALSKYPNSKVIMAQVYPTYRMNQPNMVALESTDKIEKIAAYYKNKLPAEGWIFKRRNENSAFSSTLWVKGNEQAEVRVSPTPSLNSWVVQLFVGPVTK